METEVLQPSVEVSIVVEGEIVCSVALFQQGDEELAMVVGIEDPAMVSSFAWTLDTCSRAIRTASFRDRASYETRKDAGGEGDPDDSEDIPY